ncbi:MAG: hypothetical protein J6V34_01415 [Oscillospiraceae bacterium]|nr:hypothetical protein [Oscillospiraceae bacterium]
MRKTFAIVGFIALLLLGLAALFGVILFFWHPYLQAIRDSLAYQLCWKIIFSSVVLLAAWNPKIRPGLVGRIILTLMAATLWQKFLFPSQRLLSLSLTILVFTGTLDSVVNMLRGKMEEGHVLVITCAFFIKLLCIAQTCVSLDGKIHFWPIHLGAALAVAVVIWFLGEKSLFFGWPRKLIVKIICCCCVLLCCFFFTWFTTVSLNYALDTSEPEICQMQILEKDIDSTDSAVEYKLILAHQGREVNLFVSQSDFYQLKVGDTIPVSLYQGFFKVPYYIFEG